MTQTQSIDRLYGLTAGCCASFENTRPAILAWILCLVGCLAACTDRRQAAGEEEIVRGDAAPESIQAGLLALRDFTGVTGAIRYQGSGDPLRSAVIMRLADDGSAHLHRKLDP